MHSISSSVEYLTYFMGLLLDWPVGMTTTYVGSRFLRMAIPAESLSFSAGGPFQAWEDSFL
jgi:hypothetical protein